MSRMAHGALDRWSRVLRIFHDEPGHRAIGRRQPGKRHHARFGRSSITCHETHVAYTRGMGNCDLEAVLDRLHNEPNPQRRRLIALGLLTRQLAPHGIEPILVGGGALEFYTAGGYATKDMDLALPAAPEVDAAFTALGFEKEGRYWFHAGLDLLFEAPAPAGLPGEDAPRTAVEIDGLRVVIIGIEDLLIDRLRAWVHWSSDEDGRWTRRLALLYPDRIDWCYVRERTSGIPEEAEALSRIEREACPS